MRELPALSALSEEEFTAHVTALAGTADRTQLTELLREDHPIYDERSTPDVVRMRGWLFVALARLGLSDGELIYALEELETGTDTYLVAMAAHALRTYPQPQAAFAPFVMRAISNIRYQDEHVSLTEYGGFPTGESSTSGVRELLITLTWLGEQATAIVDEVQGLRAPSGGLPRQFHADVNRALTAIRQGGKQSPPPDDCCQLPSTLQSILSWARPVRRGCETVEHVLFEDHQGASLTFGDVFQDRTSIVAFFYTRCDNPLKCTLTITKLGQVQQALQQRGLDAQIQTVAITYDPEFDIPRRLETYALNRGVMLGPNHHMLRTTAGFGDLRSYFALGVSFIDSLVNRHRIEVYVLDQTGRIAASFQRLHWGVEQVVDRAAEVLEESAHKVAATHPEPSGNRAAASPTSLAIATLTSLGVAFFPKCPICWAAYLSVFGIAGLEQIPYTPALQPLLVILMVFNLVCLWYRARATHRMGGFVLATAGVLALLIFRLALQWEAIGPWGVAATVVGAIWCVLPASTVQSRPT